MILVDVNLLIYSHVRSFPQHEMARAWPGVAAGAKRRFEA